MSRWIEDVVIFFINLTLSRSLQSEEEKASKIVDIVLQCAGFFKKIFTNKIIDLYLQRSNSQRKKRRKI